VTFTYPEVARVGLNETEARARDVAHAVTRYDLAELDRAITDESNRGMVKVLTAQRSDRILGATVVGERAGETIAEFTLAMRHGIGLKKLLATIHPYPTLSEATKLAAGEWRRANAPARVLALLERYHAWRAGR
jgi:pyruvate/2-oxoglutarate dehydrogenase complex dihydrolipoamide dehydrogenase (E3) component